MEPIKLIPLHQGRAEVWANGAENQSVHLTYDISNHLKAWPDAQPTVAFERADGEKYPHAWELDGPVLHIPLLLADTEIPGMCKCMITMLSGDGRANTVVFYGSVTEGIDSLGKEPDEPSRGIIEQVNAAAARAEAAADRAESGGTGGGSGGGSTGGGVDFVTNETLKLENGVLSVNTTDAIEPGNDLPVTSSAVYNTVGNIETILSTI